MFAWKPVREPREFAWPHMTQAEYHLARASGFTGNSVPPPDDAIAAIPGGPN